LKLGVRRNPTNRCAKTVSARTPFVLRLISLFINLLIILSFRWHQEKKD
jgi:hypothetical protein